MRWGFLFLTMPLLAAPVPQSREELVQWLNSIATARLQERRKTVDAIQDRHLAEQRQTAVRMQLRQLVGGLPDRPRDFGVKEFGSTEGDGFHVEKIAYESLPGFWVTANVYVPAHGDGPFPAVVLAPGHGPGGKLEDWNWGGNLARNGFVALAYDPIGQGER